MHLLCFSFESTCEGQHKYACSNQILKVSSVGGKKNWKKMDGDQHRSAQPCPACTGKVCVWWLEYVDIAHIWPSPTPFTFPESTFPIYHFHSQI